MSAPTRPLLKHPQSHSDALGSVRAITDNTGAVVGSYTYGPWGETLSASHPSGFTMPYLFVGGLGVRYDSTTGLHYMRNRWYDAGLGRFLSRDALGGENRYEYCRNNPVNLIDPSGLSPDFPIPNYPYIVKWVEANASPFKTHAAHLIDEARFLKPSIS